jgi:hypothetical protein
VVRDNSRILSGLELNVVLAKNKCDQVIEAKTNLITMDMETWLTRYRTQDLKAGEYLVKHGAKPMLSCSQPEKQHPHLTPCSNSKIRSVTSRLSVFSLTSVDNKDDSTPDSATDFSCAQRGINIVGTSLYPRLTIVTCLR